MLGISSRALPRIRELYQRHPGVTAPLSETFEEAAAVCLARHATPPTDFAVSCEARLQTRLFDWQSPDEQQERAWLNHSDRVAWAAYGVSLSAVEAELGLVAVARTRTLSGADYYVAPIGEIVTDLETATRLEVSGTDSPAPGRINERVRRKVLQAAHPTDPALVCVVSFAARRIVIRRTDATSAA